MADTKYPHRLYVTEKSEMYPMHELKYLRGEKDLESAVTEEETVVAVYELVRIEKYKKIVSRTEIIQELS